MSNNPVNLIDPSGLCWIGINCPGDRRGARAGSFDCEGRNSGSPSQPAPATGREPRAIICSWWQCFYVDAYGIPHVVGGRGDWLSDRLKDLSGKIIDFTINPVVDIWEWTNDKALDIGVGAITFGRCVTTLAPSTVEWGIPGDVALVVGCAAVGVGAGFGLEYGPTPW